MSVAWAARVLAVCLAAPLAGSTAAADPAAPAGSSAAPVTASAATATGGSSTTATAATEPRTAPARQGTRPPPAVLIVPLLGGVFLPISVPTAVPRARHGGAGTAKEGAR